MTVPDKNQPLTLPARDWLLVVDDDEPIRELIINAMGTDVLEVVPATDAPGALQALEQRATEPLLVLVDVLMPGIDGLTLARKLLTRLKRSKIVVISGHLTDASWWPADLREVTFLTKPFRIGELSEHIEAARERSREKR